MTARRVRPADGGLRWRADWSAFECLGCGGLRPVKRATCVDPERMAEIQEELLRRHARCWEHGSEDIALSARIDREQKAQRFWAAIKVLGE